MAGYKKPGPHLKAPRPRRRRADHVRAVEDPQAYRAWLLAQADEHEPQADEHDPYAVEAHEPVPPRPTPRVPRTPPALVPATDADLRAVVALALAPRGITPTPAHLDHARAADTLLLCLLRREHAMGRDRARQRLSAGLTHGPGSEAREIPGVDGGLIRKTLIHLRIPLRD